MITFSLTYWQLLLFALLFSAAGTIGRQLGAFLYAFVKAFIGAAVTEYREKAAVQVRVRVGAPDPPPDPGPPVMCTRPPGHAPPCNGFRLDTCPSPTSGVILHPLDDDPSPLADDTTRLNARFRDTNGRRAHGHES